jgi:predicted metalloprotease
MRWRGLRQSAKVEDKRAEGGGLGFPLPSGGARFPIGGSRGRGGIGIVGILVLLGLMLFLGVDPRAIMQGGPHGDDIALPDIRLPQSPPQPGGETGSQSQHPQETSEDEMKNFVAAVLGTTEDVWRTTFAQ